MIRSSVLAALTASTLLVVVACGGPHRETVQAVDVSVAPPEPERREVRHVVRAGQTLWRIATVYGIELEELARANGIDDPNTLMVGQSLLVPGAEKPLDVPPYPAPLGGAPADREVKTTSAPFDWPVPGGRVLSHYGDLRRTHRHKGIDIGAQRGNPVHAADSGVVVYSGSTLRGYGKTIIIDHGGALRSLYAHNSQLLVTEGKRVGRGQLIARVGRSGNASTEHCHFEVRKNDVPIDPLPYLKR